MFSFIKKDEIVVKANDFGFLVEEFVRGSLRHHYYDVEWIDRNIRAWWPKLEDYYRRHIITSIEVEIAMDDPPRPNHEPLEHKEVWKKIVADLRGPKHPFTIDYYCHKCKTRNVKLWRGVHGCADEEGHELLCASCLAPDAEVDENGKWPAPPFKDSLGTVLTHSYKTDQVKGWLPAIPVDDTYWGYSSVPSQDIEWWQALPTYQTLKV